MNEIDFSKFLVKDLKRFLRAYDLPILGKKTDLIRRLKRRVDQQDLFLEKGKTQSHKRSKQSTKYRSNKQTNKRSKDQPGLLTKLKIEKPLKIEPLNIKYDEFIAQNKRKYNEDRILHITKGNTTLACVMDGHNGQSAADFLVTNLPVDEMLTLFTRKNGKEKIANLFDQLSEEYKHQKQNAGAMISGVMIDTQKRKGMLFNVGDSKTIVFDMTNNKIITETEIIDIDKEENHRRIMEKTGCRAKCNPHGNYGVRCYGDRTSVNFLSTFGDFDDESLSSCFDRELILTPFTFDSQCKILGATDGLWDNFPKQNPLLELVKETPEKIGKKIMQSQNNGDNISIFSIQID